MTVPSGPDDIVIDIDALSRKYAEERDKRRRDDGIDQFQHLEGRFANFAKDPHANPSFSRDSICEEVDVLIIGGGFAGLLSGARLREAGVRSIRIVEKGADFGGTWYWNRYPGAQCDVESYIYLPMLEELGYLPSERYAKSSEIYAHCRKLAERFDLYPAALFQTQVKRLEWDERCKRWIGSSDRSDRISARFVVSCTGLLSTPKLPRIPGIETFEGHAFHTSRWDYSYTGGDELGKLTALADKVVGIIGTGATGIQVIPHLGASAKFLYVFQRTPSSVDIRCNAPTDPDFHKTLTVGWQRTRRNNFTAILGGSHEPIDMVQDSWTDIIRHVAPKLKDGTPVIDPHAIKISEFKKMEQVRQRIDAVVKDPATAEALKPYFNYFCKRPCFHDEYLDTYNRPNVKLIDTQGRGVERATPKGLVVGGHEYLLDCLIFATGFDFLSDYCHEAGFEILGLSMQPLSEHWARGPRTLYGIMTHGFPNLFMMSIAQAGAAVNYVHTADVQTETIAHLVTKCLKNRVDMMQPSQEAEDAWVADIIEGAKGRRAFLESCTPGYYSYEGKRQANAELNDFYAAGPMAYIELLESWRVKPDLPGMEMAIHKP
jgi:cyclohexanone monooxygenase